MYLSLAIIAIYHNYRPLLLNGAFAVVILNYALFTKPAYANIDRFSPNAYLILCLVALISQSHIGNQMLTKMEEGAIEAKNAKQKTDDLLEKVAQSVEILKKSTINLQEYATSTGNISKDLVSAFKEISVGIETQANSFSDVLQAIQDVTNTVEQTANASSNMSLKSKDTAEVTRDGQDKMKIMSSQMSEIDHFVDSTSVAMREVNEESVKIENIVSMIRKITDQTRLLSLNASIEAARAGEHGKGFSVVASEIRKLAMDSQNASQQVSAGIQLIQDKILHVNKLVQDGLQTVVSGKQSANVVEQLFELIKTNSEEVLTQAESLNLVNEKLLQSANKVSKEMGIVATISDKSSASVQAVLSNADNQQNRVNSMVTSIEALTDLTKTLDQLIN